MSKDSNFFDKYSVGELQGYFSDFFKDFYGFRPRFGDQGNWNDRVWLETQINMIHDEMDRLKETFEGREELRIRGWVVEETDPQLAQQATWLADERKREYDDWNKKYDQEIA